MAKWDLSKLPEGRKPLPDEWFRERAQMQGRIEELEAKLEELLVVSKRAVRLSLDHADFKLYAMEPMHQAIAAVELKGESDD